MIMMSTNSSSSLTFSKQTYKLHIITRTADDVDAILKDAINEMIYLGNTHPSDVLVSFYGLPRIFHFYAQLILSEIYLLYFLYALSYILYGVHILQSLCLFLCDLCKCISSIVCAFLDLVFVAVYASRHYTQQ